MVFRWTAKYQFWAC